MVAYKSSICWLKIKSSTFTYTLITNNNNDDDKDEDYIQVESNKSTTAFFFVFRFKPTNGIILFANCPTIVLQSKTKMDVRLHRVPNPTRVSKWKESIIIWKLHSWVVINLQWLLLLLWQWLSNMKEDTNKKDILTSYPVGSIRFPYISTNN